jgi:hypothetical protein
LARADGVVDYRRRVRVAEDGIVAMVCGMTGMVVARFVDGGKIKGLTHDFAPNKPEFHVFSRGDESSGALPVVIKDLKAVFFVKSYDGEKCRLEYKLFDRSKVQARKIFVRFKDGEFMVGFTVGYSPTKQGFFLTPADPDSNNTRIYVVNEAVDHVQWL